MLLKKIPIRTRTLTAPPSSPASEPRVASGGSSPASRRPVPGSPVQCAHVTRKGLGTVALRAAVTAARPSRLCKALLDEVAHQPLRPLLELGQHLVGAADLVPFQTVKEGDAHHGGCKEQTHVRAKRCPCTQFRDQRCHLRCPLRGRGGILEGRAGPCWVARSLGWIHPNSETQRALKARLTAGRVAASLAAAPEPTRWPLVISPSPLAA